ncbi:hypothetical protein [Streptomyces xanthophaeus]
MSTPTPFRRRQPCPESWSALLRFKQTVTATKENSLCEVCRAERRALYM